jgi:hypothetical protein
MRTNFVRRSPLLLHSLRIVLTPILCTGVRVSYFHISIYALNAKIIDFFEKTPERT